MGLAIQGEVIVVYGEAGIRKDLVRHPVSFVVGLAGRISIGTLVSLRQECLQYHMSLGVSVGGGVYHGHRILLGANLEDPRVRRA